LEDKYKWWNDKILNDDSWQFFVVKPLDKDMIIGSIGLTYIHPIYKSAEFSITIGHKDYRGGGYGSDALRTIIKYGFEQLNLNRIWCEVYSNNDAIDIYRHIGFKDEGILRQTVFKNSEYLDSYVLGMLKSDYVEIKENF
jgi:RimJ/RimL family protein N-acetyltransferase